MAGRSAGASIAASGTNNANTETVLITSPVFIVPSDGNLLIVTAWFAITFGASATGYNLKLRRGPTTADVVVSSVNAVTATGGQVGQINMVFTESLAARASVQYSLTYQGIAETGTSSNLGGGIAVFASI